MSLKNQFKRFNEFWWQGQGFTTLLVILLIFLFLSPFAGKRLNNIILAVFYIPLLISGVATVTQSRLLRGIAFAEAVIVLLFNILHQNFPGKLFTGCWYVSILLFFALLISVLLHQVFRDGPVSRHRIRGAVAAYLLIGLTWTYIYLLIALLVDGAFSFPPTTTARPDDPTLQSTLAYFSFVTLTTLGYGDTVAVHHLARMFAILEALIGMLYPATLLARLVSLEIMHRNTPAQAPLPEQRKNDRDK